MKIRTINKLLILKKVNTIDTHTKEQQFSNLVRSCHKEYVGEGPNSIRVSFKDNWAIAHMTGVLSKVGSFYLDDKRNGSMLHYIRTEKIKQMYKEIDINEMKSLIGTKFVKLFTDIDLNDDEVISIFVFDKSIE